MKKIRHAIFLSGPVGAGKSTLGAALADALNGTFIEGDEHAASDTPWYGRTLSTARSILRSIDAARGERPIIIAYPLRCIEWIFYRRHLADHGIRIIVVSLAADYRSITSSQRGRRFSASEQSRIRRMIDEGYGRRRFSDLILRTDGDDEAGTLGKLLSDVSLVIRSQA